MADSLQNTRKSLRAGLSEFSIEKKSDKSEEEVLKDEAAYAASGLNSADTIERIKAVEFLEILNSNPFAQEHLIKALSDKEASIVQKAIHALGKVATRKAIPLLKEFILSSKSKHIVAELSKIIGKLDRISE